MAALWAGTLAPWISTVDSAAPPQRVARASSASLPWARCPAAMLPSESMMRILARATVPASKASNPVPVMCRLTVPVMVSTVVDSVSCAVMARPLAPGPDGLLVQAGLVQARRGCVRATGLCGARGVDFLEERAVRAGLPRGLCLAVV